MVEVIQHNDLIPWVWEITARDFKTHYVRCPSRSGAKIYLAKQIGSWQGPFRSAQVFESDVPEGCPILQAEFLRPDDPRNWQ